MNEIKTELASTVQSISTNSTCQNTKQVPLLITIDDDDNDDEDDDEDMQTVPTFSELKTVPQNTSSLEEDSFSVDVKPLHHELLIEDVPEEEIESQSSFQCQSDWIKEEVSQITDHDSMNEETEPLRQELHFIDVNVKQTEEACSDENSIPNNNSQVKKCEKELDVLSEKELLICQFLLRQSEPIMGELGYIFNKN